MIMPESKRILEQTLNWVRSIIIDLNVCPFAKHVVNQGSLVMEVMEQTSSEEALQALMAAISKLDKQPEIETCLLIYPSQYEDFYDYLDFVELAEALLFEQGYEGLYQLATFHPHYCFAEVALDDVSNYTNRSPYPMLHILRESSLDKAIEFYGDTSKIPENNIKTMHQLGLDKVKKILDKL